MYEGAIWWGRLGQSLRYLGAVSERMRDGRSVVLKVPSRLPWREDFYARLERGRARLGIDRRFKRVCFPSGCDPGQFVLQELCSEEDQVNYWPGQTCAEYLAAKDDLMLNDCFIWVTGIHTKSDLSEWARFVSSYERLAGNLERCGIFLLEYDGPDMDIPEMETLAYRIEESQCRVFCLETADSGQSEWLREYQAELALRIGGTDPEFCAALLKQGRDLLETPVEIAVALSRTARHTDGSPFPAMDETQVTTAVWEAAVVQVFPLLEHCRLDFIGRHEEDLARFLPINSAWGETIEELRDLEIGPLTHIVSQTRNIAQYEEMETLWLCRKIRNALAHNRIVPLEDIQNLMERAVPPSDKRW